MLRISDFSCDRKILEIRYPKNFLYWDRVGALWSRVAEIFPQEIPVQVDPNHTQFEAGDYLLYVDNDQLRVTGNGNVSNSQFQKCVAEFVKIVVEFLEISVYLRVGYRQILTTDFANLSEAVTAYESLKGVSKSANIFGISEAPKVYSSITSWEGEKLGSTLSIRTERRKQDVQIPWEIRSAVKVESSEQFFLVIDVDYFTNVALTGEQLSAGEWVKSTHKTVERSIENGVL